MRGRPLTLGLPFLSARPRLCAPPGPPLRASPCPCAPSGGCSCPTGPGSCPRPRGRAGCAPPPGRCPRTAWSAPSSWPAQVPRGAPPPPPGPVPEGRSRRGRQLPCCRLRPLLCPMWVVAAALLLSAVCGAVGPFAPRDQPWEAVLPAAGCLVPVSWGCVGEEESRWSDTACLQ